MLFKKRGLYNKIAVICGIILTASFVVSCAGQEVADENVKIYYIGPKGNGLESWDSEVKVNTIENEKAVEDLLGELSKGIVTSKSQAAITDPISIKSFKIEGDVVKLDFFEGYEQLGRIEEVLHRAAIVKTLTQLKKVNYVSFAVEGQPITDHLGNQVGEMKSEDFIFNIGSELNEYEQYEIKLYFANESKDKLVPVYRSVVYNSSASVEKMAVEQIIAGPKNDQICPTIAPETKVSNLSVKDGVCHIDFSKDFLSEPFEIDPELAIYSIVNTVTEFPNVEKVELKVEGSDEFMFRDFQISGLYERNPSLIN